ncbi:hypothetical protein B0T26DRAFT_237047 [Lasiosphaeria miniovina]|uniref:Zn(2)-C6 fungal-type domain-containing protein n=1 Tax=Lasiosphaeria miniovina TaxID=1954250 RepID=A0AA40AVL2_9PEZI|nr:uncharacterized protein B0T26DRAFT_237047 [Lasiosphaeria miniovina]KAK0722845.1 hypothetical protein B0T26DRAFT_237047 [Lasiosphaeria miniovina]
MSSTQVTVFANTFLVSQTGDGGRPSVWVVGPDEARERRRKRSHRKSRMGCVRCKRRKVKCDEADPCSNCVRRLETCVRSKPAPSSQGPTTVQRKMLCATVAELGCGGPVNLLQLELLHHFERSTLPTLAFQEIWPSLLQLAFQSQEHAYLVNAILSLAAAHLDYLAPDTPRYRRANCGLLDRALHGYRSALSAPITAENCDALLGTAILVNYLMWCDLDFMEGQAERRQQQALDLSADQLYWLSTGVRQIFFMAWPLFQSERSVFFHVPILQPCMAIEDAVEARGLRRQGLARGFVQLYDNPRYHGGRNAFRADSRARPRKQQQQDRTSHSPTPSASPPSSSSSSSATLHSDETWSSSFTRQESQSLKVLTLWQSYKEGEAFVGRAGAEDYGLMRAAYKRLAERLAVAMAFASDGGVGGGCPAAFPSKPLGRSRSPVLKSKDIVRYVMTFPMICFGSFLPLITEGDSRGLVVLFHIYRVVRQLLPPADENWWCRRRTEAMEAALRCELRARGLEVCLRKQDAVS